MRQALVILSITVILLGISNHSYSQASYSENKYIKYRKTPNKDVDFFFTKYPTVYSLTMLYSNRIPRRSLLFFREFDENNYYKSLYFDLEYEADSIYFNKSYNVNNIVSKMKKFSDFESHETSKNDLYSIVIFRDSVVYRFIKDRDFIENEKQKFLGWPASYGGNIKDLERRISISYKKEKKVRKKVDSVYVFKCMVLRNDSLGDIEQIVGKPSSLSDIIIEEFRKSSKSWRAAILETSGLRHDTFIRVSVRLNSDESITIKTPKGLHTIQGY